MSIREINRVWETSPHKGSELLLLLAIADHANDHGEAWPSQETLAAKTRMSVRQVRRLALTLEESGALGIQRKRLGSKTMIVYTLFTAELPQSTGQDVRSGQEELPDISGVRPDIAVSAEPSIEPSEDQDLSPAPPSKAERDAIWDALEVQFGKPATDSHRRRFGKAQRELLSDRSLTPGEVAAQIPLRAARYKSRWPGVSFTLEAFAKHWPDLGSPSGPSTGAAGPELPDGEVF